MADISQADFNKLMDGWATSANGKKALAAAVLTAKAGSVAVPDRDVLAGLKDIFGQVRPALVFPPDHKENTTSGLPADAPLRKLLELPGRVAAIEAKLDGAADK